MPAQIGYFDTLKSVAGKVFTYLASITLTGTDGKTITVTQDTTLDEAVAMSSKAPKASPSFTVGIGIGGVAAGTGGVAFPAVAVAVADANTLDDYEEGTFQVTLVAGTSGTITINPLYDTLSYTKIGRMVTVIGFLYVESVSSPVGQLAVRWLPFVNQAGVEGSGRAPIVCRCVGLAATATTAIQAWIPASQNVIYINKFAAGTDSALAGDVQANSEFYINATYFI